MTAIPLIHPDRTDTGLLPTHDDGKAADEYSKLGLTGKVKVSQTELKIGTLIPELPTLQPNDGRILPQTFEGGLLTSKEVKGLTFTGGRLDKAKDRNDTNWEDLALNNKNGRFGGSFSAARWWEFRRNWLRAGGVVTGAVYALSMSVLYLLLFPLALFEKSRQR